MAFYCASCWNMEAIEIKGEYNGYKLCLKFKQRVDCSISPRCKPVRDYKWDEIDRSEVKDDKSVSDVKTLKKYFTLSGPAPHIDYHVEGE